MVKRAKSSETYFLSLADYLSLKIGTIVFVRVWHSVLVINAVDFL